MGKASEYSSRQVIRRILDGSHVVAVVGLSEKPDRPSHRVASYLQAQGYKIVPVNPNATAVLGEKAYPDLASVPQAIDVVDIFRKSQDVGPIVEEAIRVKSRAVWMQEGVVNEEAAERARDAGLDVVMDLCMMKEHMKLGEDKRFEGDG